MHVFLAAAFVLGAATAAPAQDVVWNHLEVVAKLANDGSLRVVETHDIAIRGETSTLGRDFGLGVGQSVVVTRLARLDGDGGEHALVAGDVKQADHYAAYPTWVQWSVKDGAAPPFEPSALRYRLEYELVHAVAPAWDLPNGVRPLDGLHPSYGSPIERVLNLWPLWKEAWPHIDSHYRLDHDVMFPNRGKPDASLVQLDYRLEWDVATWSLVDPRRDIGKATPDVDYRVQRTLRRLVPEAPTAVDFDSPSRRLAALLLLPVGVVVLWLLMKLLDALRGADQARLSAELFEEIVASEPPELVRARIAGRAGRVGFGPFLKRLASERKLAISTQRPVTEDEPLHVRLRLQVDRNALHPYEREVVSALFGNGSEVTTDDIQKRHADGDFDPEALVSRALARVVPPRPRRNPIASGLGSLLLGLGLWLSVADLMRIAAEPYATLAGVAGGLVMRLGLPPAILWASLVGTLLQLVPNIPLVGWASVGVSLMVLAGYQGRLAGTLVGSGPEGRRLADLARLRGWAQKQLARPQPALRDAWIPHLEALGLAPALERWRRQHAGATSLGAPDLSEVAAGEALSGPPFTGEPPRSDVPTDDEWASGFYAD